MNKQINESCMLLNKANEHSNRKYVSVYVAYCSYRICGWIFETKCFNQKQLVYILEYTVQEDRADRGS